MTMNYFKTILLLGLLAASSQLLKLYTGIPNGNDRACHRSRGRSLRRVAYIT